MEAAMKLARWKFLHLATGAVVLPAVIAKALTYPTRPLTMIAPFALGGSRDVGGRVLTERMRKSLGQPIIIENLAGVHRSIGVDRAARARPDGYTPDLGFLGIHVLNGAFYLLPYDVLNDFAAISLLFTAPFVIFAKRTMPAKDLLQLIARLKVNSDQASMGTGTPGVRALMAFFQKETGTHFTVARYRRFSAMAAVPESGLLGGVQ
jgi:tripartite-type tricarboxylate transporter receptor subunit TctC